MAKHNEVGILSEDLALKYLKNKGFFIIERNFLCKVGEIDIIATKNEETKKIYFIEVKSKSVENFNEIDNYKDYFSPENNFSYKKREKMLKAIKYYLYKNKCDLDIECEISLIVIYLNEKIKQAKIKTYETVVL